LLGSRLLRALVFGVAPTDAATYAIAGIGLFGIALLASWLPARQASRLAPHEALRRG
jgi:ABC-type lipoprotein release transport system permease subunit